MKDPSSARQMLEMGLMVHGNIVGGRVHPHRVGGRNVNARAHPVWIDCRRLANFSFGA
jgi:hypothetical protein